MAKSGFKFKKDTRGKFIAQLEKDIQRSADYKDRSLKISSKYKWKKFYRNQDGFKIYAVDGDWIKNNLDMIFCHGGHGHVHEFIPKNEIWVSINHHKKCECKKSVVRKSKKVSRDLFDSIVIHEIAESKLMKSGMPYWKAHQIARRKEKKFTALNSE